ncbi:MAG: hypothetical protein J0L75_13935 [Spirochaetes bacterium]|nr:hypothetical protein [Spirochaetota bacterium]
MAVGRACPTALPVDAFPPRRLLWADLCARLCETLPIPTGPMSHLAFIAEAVHATLEIHTQVTERSIGEGTSVDPLAILSGDYLYTCALERIPELDREDLENEAHDRILASCRGKLLGSIDRRIGHWWWALRRGARSEMNPGALAGLCLVAPAILLGLPRSRRDELDRLARRWARALERGAPFRPRVRAELEGFAVAIRAVHPFPASTGQGATP